MKGSSGNIECSFSHTTEMFRSEARENNSFLNTFLVCKCSSGQVDFCSNNPSGKISLHNREAIFQVLCFFFKVFPPKVSSEQL